MVRENPSSDPVTQIIDTTVSDAALPKPTGLPGTLPPPGDGSNGNGGQSSKHRKKGGWRRILRIFAWTVAFLFTLLLGVGVGGASTADPTTSTQYKDLQQQLTSQQEQTQDVQKQLDALNEKVGDLDSLQKQLDEQKNTQEQTQKDLDKQKSEQERTQKQLDEKQKVQEQKQSELDEREKNIAQREAEKKRKEQEAIQAAQQQAQAAQQQAQAEQQQQAAAAPQSPQTDGSGVLVAVCKDGTQSTSSPGARDYRGMCSHHGGIAQRLGRQ